MTDKELIEKLGGVNVICKYFGFKKQRVCNWKTRNAIPSLVKVSYPEVFMPKNENEVKPLAGKQ